MKRQCQRQITLAGLFMMAQRQNGKGDLVDLSKSKCYVDKITLALTDNIPILYITWS